MRNPIPVLRQVYGAHPLHLLALLGCFALAGDVAVHLVDAPLLVRMIIWFLAAVIGHDLVLFPLYALADRSLSGVLRLLPSAPRKGVPVVAPLNYLRTPALGAGLTFLLFLPGIIQQGTQTYFAATGQTQAPYLGRWLLLVAAMFIVSAVVYAISTRVAGAPARAAARRLRSVLTEAGERVVSVADLDGHAAAMFSSHALYHVVGDGEWARWQRIGWEDVAEVDWSTADGGLVVDGLPGALADRVVVALDERADVVEVARGLIATTVLVTVPIHLGAALRTAEGVLTIRQQPHSERLIWRVRLNNGADPADPQVRDRVDAAIHVMSSELGLPAPPAAISG
jgi:hypothetical protein